MINSEENIQHHLLLLHQMGFITLSERQHKLLDSFALKYQKIGLPSSVYQELIKDVKKVILFA